MSESKLQRGQLLKDRYRITEIIGEGAFGTVYCAEDLKVGGSLWAIKEIRESLLPLDERQEVIAHFYSEAEILKDLNHTGVPKIIDIFASNHCHYMVMEHVQGRTLESLAAEGDPDVQSVVGWALRLCDILQYLHEQKPSAVIFRDLKPSNVMITSRGRLLLVDFGVARHFKTGKKSDTVPLGTPGFAAPEQYGAAQSDVRTDIYGLGATIFSLLSGADVASFNFLFPPLSSLNPSVGPALEGIVARCLERIPQKRFESAKQVQYALTPIFKKKKHGRQSVAPQAISGGQSTSIASAAAPRPISPLPPAARLWNPPVRKSPLKIPFAPDWLMTLLEDLVVPAKRGARAFAILFGMTIMSLMYFAWFPYTSLLCCLGLVMGILCLPVLIVNRLYFYAISVIIMLSVDVWLLEIMFAASRYGHLH